MKDWNLVNALKEAAKEKDLGVTFIGRNIADKTFLNYKTILEESLKLAACLSDQGIKKGERVAIMLPNTSEFYFSFLGTILAGGIPVALYPPMRLGKLLEWEKRTKLLLASVSPFALISKKSLLALAPNGQEFFTDKLAYISPKMRHNYAPLSTTAQPAFNDICFIQFSSGTTNNPKAIAVTHKNINHNIEAFLKTLPQIPGRKKSCVSWLPLYHDMGLVGCMLAAIKERGHLILLRPEQFLARPILWLEAISLYRADFTVAPNFAYGLCNKRIKDGELDGLNLDSLKVMMCGAETVDPATMNKFYQKFSKVGLDERSITPVYGMAETTLAATFSNPFKRPDFCHFDKDFLLTEKQGRPSEDGIILTNLGRPLPEMEIKIFSKKGEELSEGLLGEVGVKGPSVTPGRFDKAKGIISHDHYHGFMRTGDGGFLLKGDLFLWGRLKDIIIISGKNIDAHLIENLLDKNDELRTGCHIAFGISGDNGMEELIVLSETKTKKHFNNWKKNPENRQKMERIIYNEIYQTVGIRPKKNKSLFSWNTS